MNTLKNRLRRALVPSVLRDERGLSTVEYTIILVLIAVAGIVLWGEFGSALKTKITGATDDINNMSGDQPPQ